MKIISRLILRVGRLIAKEVSKQQKKDTIIRELIKQNSQSDGYILNTKGRSGRIVVSLTSYGHRVSDVFLTIESLAQQSMLADEIVLWLSKTEFSDKNIPQSLKNLERRGLKIRFCEDFKSYKKLVPTLLDYPNDIIITVDDDMIYNSNFVLGLYSTHEQFPNTICCYRGHLIKLKNRKISPYHTWSKKVDESVPSHYIMATGVGGVLYFPNCFYKDITNVELFTKLCPTADDIWFKFMALLNGTKYKIASAVTSYDDNIVLDQAQINDLAKINVLQNGNDMQIKNIVEYYKLKIEEHLN